MKGLWTITRELPQLNRVGGGVIHVTDRSHKYNAGWYRDEFAPVRFIRAGFYITRRQSDKCKVVQRYAPLSEYFRRGAFILLMDMSDKSGWYRAGAPLHGYFPWRCFLFSGKEGMDMKWNKMMRWTAAIVMVAAAVSGLTGCGAEKKTSAVMGDAKVAKVGFLNGVTGGVAAYGIAEKGGFDLAVEEVNHGGKIHFDVEMADTKGNIQQAVSAAQKMISDKKVIVIGPLISGEYKAVGPLFQKAKIPLLGAATTAEGLMEIGDYMFRNCVPESKNIPQTVAKTHKLLGYKRVAVLYSNNNEHQVSAYKIFKKSLEAEGVEIVLTETFADKDTDFSAQLTKIHDVKPDAVIVAGYYQEGGLILKKMREMGMDQPVLGDNGFVSPELVKIAGKAADNVYVSSMWSPDRDSEATREFVKNFRAKYNHDPDNFAACAYVSVKLAAKAMEDAGTTIDSAKLRDALAKVQNFESAVGSMTFNGSGDPEVDLVLLKVENGKYTALNVK